MMQMAGMRALKGGLAVAILLAAGGAWAQPALLTNARVEVRRVAGDVAAAFDAAVGGVDDEAWIAYAVPMAPGDRFICDWTDRDRAPVTSVKLEGGDTLYVFYRVAARGVARVRMFSEGCGIDAGGLRVTWLESVGTAGSVGVLSGLLGADGTSRRVVNGALAALAMHEGAAATKALLDAARRGATPHVRSQALFWTAQRAGREALPAISDAVANDPDTDVKKRAVFALAQLPAGEGVPRLIEVAEHHSNPAVRKQAMFWLGQSKDPRALAFFERILLR